MPNHAGSLPNKNDKAKWALTRLFGSSTFGAGKFVCAGNTTLLKTEKFLLNHIWDWTEITGSKTDERPECILIGELGSGTISVRATLMQYGEANFILAYMEEEITARLSEYEQCHYRLFCQHNNTYYFYRLRKENRPIDSRYHLDDPEIKAALIKSRHHLRNLPPDTAAEIMQTDARRLLVPERFDIAIKCNYGRLKNLNAGKAWRDFLYHEHILRITGPGKNIREYDGTGKQGLKAFLESFDSLLAASQPESIPCLPVNRDYIAMDGAHRIAAAIVNHRPIRCVRLDTSSNHRATSTFFAGRQHGHAPCQSEILDEAAIEYCRIKTGLAVALIFPTVASDTPALEHLKKLGKIVHYKKVIMSPKAGGALLRQVYLGHTWFENCADDAGFINKQKSCFPFKGTLRAVLIDDFDPANLRQAKEDIRNIFGVGNHSIHITDSDEETLRVARVVFNQNSLDILEAGIGNLPLFHQKLARYRSWLEENSLDPELFSIDGSAILSLLGLRECRDLDFIYLGKPSELPATAHGIDCHNEQAQFHMHSIPEIIGDPRLHCWYMGIKFCAPIVVLQMKQARAEHKDIRDIALLKKHLPANHFPWLAWKTGRGQFILACSRVYWVRAKEYLKVPLRPIWHAIRKQYTEYRK